MTQVTGPLFDESGNLLENTVCTVVAKDAIIGQSGGARVKRGVTVETDADGIFDIDLKAGRYVLFVHPTESDTTSLTNQVRGSITVLSEGPMTLQSALGTDVGDITPSVLQQAVEAAADAAESANEAEIAANMISLSGNRFNVLNYIDAQTGGDAQVTLIKEGRIQDQDPSIVTAGVQAAFVAWWESGNQGQVYFDAGSYMINDEAMAGVTSGGKTVQRHIADGDQGQNRGVTVEGVYAASYICVDKNFAKTDTSFIDKCVLRFESPSSKLPQPVVRNLVFYSNISRPDRSKCPTAIKSCRGNYANFEGLIFRGREAGIDATGGADWSGTAMHIEYINNSHFANIRMKAGYQPTVVDMWADDPARFDANGVTQIVCNDATSPFANPGAEADSFWDGLWLIATGNAGTTADSFLLKTAATGAKTDDNTLNLDPAHSLPDGSATGFNISFQMVGGSMTSGSNVLTLNAPVLSADDEGRCIHVSMAGDPNNSGKLWLSAYIKPDSISADGKTCEMVHSDGVTPANAVNTTADRYVIFSPGFYMGQTTEMSGGGHNNDLVMSNVVSENARGGAMFFFENVLSCSMQHGKAHGISTNSPIRGSRQFSEVGYLVVADNCKHLPLDSVLLTHAQACPINGEHVNAVLLTGERNHVSIEHYELYGAANKTRFFALQGTSQACNLHLGSGLNNIVNFNGASVDMGLFDFVNSTSGPQNIYANGILENRYGATSQGVIDDLALYSNWLPTPEDVTISGGSITINNSFVRVDTEGGAASDDLDTITGGVPNCVLTLKTVASGRDVVLRDNVGNIQTLNQSDVTLGLSRQIIQLVYVSGKWLEIK